MDTIATLMLLFIAAAFVYAAYIARVTTPATAALCAATSFIIVCAVAIAA